MSIIYKSSEVYELSLDDRTIELSQNDIVEIANYAHINHFKGCISSILEEQTEILKETIKLLEEQISGWKFEYKKIYEDMAEVLKNDETK